LTSGLPFVESKDNGRFLYSIYLHNYFKTATQR